MAVDDRATNSTAIEAIQTLLRVLCYLPAGSNEAIRGLCKTLAGLLLASAQHPPSSLLAAFDSPGILPDLANRSSYYSLLSVPSLSFP